MKQIKNTKDYNYENPLQKNQHVMRSTEKLQKIIDSKPQNWTKKDFRGEGKNNNTKILTRKETEREGLVFGIEGNKDKYKKNKMRCSICNNFKNFNEFSNDAHASNQKRSNCKECDIKRNLQFYNNETTYFKEYEKKRWSKIKKDKDLLEKKRERDREYYINRLK